jgi:hypothetical protein
MASQTTIFYRLISGLARLRIRNESATKTVKKVSVELDPPSTKQDETVNIVPQTDELLTSTTSVSVEAVKFTIECESGGNTVQKSITLDFEGHSRSVRLSVITVYESLLVAQAWLYADGNLPTYYEESAAWT